MAQTSSKNDTSCRLDRNLNSPINISNAFVSDSILCEFNLKFSAVPSSIHRKHFASKNGEDRKYRKIPRKNRSVEDRLSKFLSGLSKDELCGYMIQLLTGSQTSNLRHCKGTIGERSQDVQKQGTASETCQANIASSSPRLFCKSCKHRYHEGDRYRETNATVELQIPGINAEQEKCGKFQPPVLSSMGYSDLNRPDSRLTASSGDLDSYHRAILKSIDFLCNLRSLFDHSTPEGTILRNCDPPYDADNESHFQCCQDSTANARTDGRRANFVCSVDKGVQTAPKDAVMGCHSFLHELDGFCGKTRQNENVNLARDGVCSQGRPSHPEHILVSPRVNLLPCNSP